MGISRVIAEKVALDLVGKVSVHFLVEIVVGCAVWIIFVRCFFVVFEHGMDFLFDRVACILVVIDVLPEFFGEVTEALIDRRFISLDYLDVGVDVFGDLVGCEILLRFEDIESLFV